jgi:hypothetical protein
VTLTDKDRLTSDDGLENSMSIFITLSSLPNPKDTSSHYSLIPILQLQEIVARRRFRAEFFALSEWRSFVTATFESRKSQQERNEEIFRREERWRNMVENGRRMADG